MDRTLFIKANMIAPSELSAALPRRIRATQDTLFAVILLAVFTGVSAICCVWFWSTAATQMRNMITLRRYGANAVGQIDKLGRVGRSANSVTYTFAANGGTVSGKAEVPSEFMQRLEESGGLSIRYLPSNPAINHPAAWEWPLASLWVAIFGPMILVPFCVAGFTVLQRRRRLLANGIPAAAIVTGCTEGKRTFSVRYKFQTENGALIAGRGWSLKSIEVGECIWIIYLPGNPTRNLPYPLLDYYIDK